MQFNGYRSGLNEFLERQDLGFSETNNEIFETFLYGAYAHYNERKEEKLKEWEKKGREFFLRRKMMFLTIAGTFWWTIDSIYPLVKSLLDGLPLERENARSTRS